MKKRLLFVLPILAATTAVSCSGIDEDHSIVAMKNYDSIALNLGLETAYEINSDKLYNMLDNKYSFVIEIYQETCSLCQTFAPILDEYIKNTHREFYRLGLNSKEEIESFYWLENEFPDVFSEFSGTPAVYYIDEGKLTYSVNPAKFSSYTAFSKIADKHFYDKNFYSVSSLFGLETYLHDKETSFIYMMDPTSIVSSEVYRQIHNEIKHSDKNVLIIDSASITEENYAQICAKLDVGVTDHFAIYYNGQDVKKNVNYLLDDASTLKTWITNYLA